jgi:hypothetical protein
LDADLVYAVEERTKRNFKAGKVVPPAKAFWNLRIANILLRLTGEVKTMCLQKPYKDYEREVTYYIL